MRISALKYTALTWVSGLTMVILFLMPFHALITVWLASIFDHYTAFRLWKEALLALSVLGALYLLATDHKIRFHTLSRRLVWLILTYILLNVVWGLLALDQGDVSAKALSYGLISNLRYLVFFLVTWSVALRLPRLRNHWQWLVYFPAIGVVVFGLLQIFVLPTDFMRHFGYSEATIPVYETVNSNQDYVRIASTLRGPNPLGAYLVIPISLVTVLMLRKGRNWRYALFLAAAAVVLFFSFSRSAVIGALLSVVVILFLSHLSRKSQKIALGVVGGLVAIGLTFTVALWNNPHFQNFVFHTQDQSQIKISSNDARERAITKGIKEVWEHPLGGGPGTAGPASVYNQNRESRIAENYFVQIGQEVGWLGLAMFILINLGVGALLYVRRGEALALSLFASLVGLTLINLVSHAWTDDTLAYVWWGLAGVAMAPLPEKQVKPEEVGPLTQPTKAKAKPRPKKRAKSKAKK